MPDITPDEIARIATRLYNSPAGIDVQNRATEASLVEQGRPAVIAPASIDGRPPGWTPPQPQDAPSSGVAPLPRPTADWSRAESGLSTGAVSSPSVPRHPGMPPIAITAPTPSPSPDGLRAFIAQVRSHSVRHGEDSYARPPFSAAIPTEQSHAARGPRPLDVPAIRAEFPALQQRVHGQPLVWFDNAATTQKPQYVIDALSRFYQQDNSNIHRGAHTLAARATEAYEQARQKVQQFLGASSSKEIVFVRGTTEGINLAAQSYGRKFLQPGDEIVLSTLEHHANIVPWQMVAKEKGARLRVIPVNDQGEILMEEYQKILGPRTALVALTHASNSLGTILPVFEMTQLAKRYGARVLIDGAQSVAHLPVNVQQLGCDFYVFSGHKIFGPTGIGALFIKEELHDVLPPWQGGGNMIRNVTFEETTYSEAPAKFEAGTPNIADAVGLGAALDYVQRLGLPQIGAYEQELLRAATDCLARIPGLRMIGSAREKVGVVSFVLPHRSTEEVGRLLDQHGIAVRAGHHCAQPSLRRFGLESTVRPSFTFYNTHDEIDRLGRALRDIVYRR